MPWIKKCLDSCEGYSVVVVDNASTDVSVDYIKSHYKSVHIIEQTSNLGFGQANNIGITYALKKGAEHLFLLNQDAYLIDDVLQRLRAFQRENTEYGILSPIHLTANKVKLDRNFAGYIKRINFSDRDSFNILEDDQATIYELPFVNAAAWMLSKDCVETVGGFDPIFFHYGEDANYCQRLRFHGFKVGVLSRSYIIHDRSLLKKPKPLPNSEAYYKKYERHSKIALANINDVDYSTKIVRRLNLLKKQWIGGVLTMNFKKIHDSKTKRTILKRMIKELETSRQINKNKGQHHLNV